MEFSVGDRVTKLGEMWEGIITKLLDTTYGKFAVVKIGERKKGIFVINLVKII